MLRSVFLVIFTLGIELLFAQENLPAWKKGDLDIHHISTGSGNSAFVIFPDGTTLLIDAGDVNSPPRPSPVLLKTSPRLPHDSLSAAKSIALYIRHVLPAIKSIDYALITHFHGDHYGVVSTVSPSSKKGSYKLNGITEIDEYLPITKIIDRGFPDYNYPVDLKVNHQDTLTLNNYLRFVSSRLLKRADAVTSLAAGRDDQITMLYDGRSFDNFSVRNIKSNGNIWAGSGTATTSIIPGRIAASDYNENPLSLALTINYGAFDYFTGGDMPGISGGGMPSWFDVETPVAKILGEVDALSLDHHGVRDAVNEFFLKSTTPRVIVQQSWSSNHPGEEVLHRIISPYLFKGPRDIFATYIHQATLDTYGRWMKDNYKSMRGHILIRVSPKGSEYNVYILDDTKVSLPVTAKFGPYQSR